MATHSLPVVGLAWAVALAASACGSPEVASGADAAVACPPSSLMVAASDEQTSSEVGILALDGGSPSFDTSSILGHDPALTSSNGRVFWIDRGLGNVLELDPRCPTVLHGPWTTSDPDSPGATDPQDIAVDPTTGNVWIARYQVSTILVKSPDGSTALGTIDLSGVAGLHSNPYMSSIRIIDGPDGWKAYVTLEMQESTDPIDPGYIVKLDVATALASGEVEDALQLKGRNPFGLMVEDDDDDAIFIAAPGSFFDATETDAGIERVDLRTFTSELVIRESDIGASVDEVAVASGCGVAIVLGPSAMNPTSLITFTYGADAGAIRTGLAESPLATPLGFFLGGLAWLPGPLIAVGDGTAVAGRGYPVHLLSASAGCTLSQTPPSLFAPQPPVALLPTPG